MSPTRGRFVTFEGIDGAGKSSHVEWYADLLRRRGRKVTVTREPGGTELAEAIRDWVLARPMSMRVEALLVFAARQDHLDRVIRPALAAGTWVVCDRFTDSTVAYQGGGRGLPLADIDALERWVHPDLRPDRTLLFDLDPAVAEARRRAARPADRFEGEQQAFFGRVREAYLARAAADPQRFLRIDGARSVDEIRALLEEDAARY
ncbi:MAG TPA: dTMP kinase [Burkholderiaceae bacterium]|nr:dTMP kinase [Burkholderiaceae bacterium]